MLVFMGLVNQCSMLSTAMLGEKLGGGPTDHSAGLEVVSGALLLRSTRVYPTLLMACEMLSRT
jgi:hypothetical protein